MKLQPAMLNWRRSALPPSALRPFAQLATILLLGLYVLNLGYGFDGSFTRLKDFTFVSSALTGEEKSGTPGNRFADTPLAELPVPLPRQYLLGVDIQKHDFEDYGQPSYLRGEWKDGGWWYYYLYGLAVKTPHGTQFLLALAIILMIHRWWANRSASTSPRRGEGRGEGEYGQPSDEPAGAPQGRSPSATWRDLVILLTPAVTVMVLVSSQLEFNHHVRYVLPVLGFTFVFIGSVARLSSATTHAASGRRKAPLREGNHKAL